MCNANLFLKYEIMILSLHLLLGGEKWSKFSFISDSQLYPVAHGIIYTLKKNVSQAPSPEDLIYLAWGMALCTGFCFQVQNIETHWAKNGC